MDQTKCQIREPAVDLSFMHAVMDCRAVTTAVIIFLCLLSAQTASVPARNGTRTRALKTTLQLMQNTIQATLRLINESNVIPDNACLSVNITELFGLEQQHLMAQNLSSLQCHMQKMSKVIVELSPKLLIISQHAQAMESLMSSQPARLNCSLPPSEQDMDNYVHVKCLLEFLDQWISKASFNFTA